MSRVRFRKGERKRSVTHFNGDEPSALTVYNHMVNARIAISRTLLSATTEEQTLSEVCRIAVEQGNVKMAWIGREDLTSQRIVPVASFGNGTEYLDEIFISTQDSLPESKGPTGVAYREKKPVVLQDYHHPATAPWRIAADKYGWKSSLSIPILCGSQTYGVLTVYHIYVNAFDHRMVDLFEELSFDLSLKLDKLELLEQQRKMNEVLSIREKESHRLALVAERTDNPVIITDAAGRIEWVNDAFTNLTEYTLTQVIGAVPGRLLQGPDTDQATVRFMRERIGAGIAFSTEVLNYSKSGREYWVSMDIQPLKVSDGTLEGFISVQRNITEKKHQDQEIYRLAFFDGLTGLPNRSLLTKIAEEHLEMCRHQVEPFCVVFMDLDQFKHVNDTMGHSFGDQLLKSLSKRLMQHARPSDVCARVGGDEFIVLLKNTDKSQAESLVEDLRNQMSEPTSVGGRLMKATFSYGIASFPEDGEDFETLYRLADIAMYHAKAAGRNLYRICEPAMVERTLRMSVLEADLNTAIQENQLQLFYQPKVSLRDGSVIGMEALLRWEHPSYGWISPVECIALAEQSGQMIYLGDWVLRTAMAQMKKWHDLGYQTRVAINLSAVQLHHSVFFDTVSEMLAEAQLDANYVTFELTETTALSDANVTLSLFRAFRERGILIAIDDFGTGFSSLSYLTQFRPDHVKIDKSFIQRMESSPHDEAVVDAILEMTRSLNSANIAEGVETKSQLRRLLHKGCHAVQGYYISPPMRSEDASKWLHMWKLTGAKAFLFNMHGGN